MHELPMVKRIVDIAESHARRETARRVLAVRLSVGSLCDVVPLWVERYFRKLSAGTLLEGARLLITSEAARVRCLECAAEFPAPAAPIGRITCPQCGSGNCSLVAGLDWRLESIEVE